jgi:hypothetical protein
MFVKKLWPFWAAAVLCAATPLSFQNFLKSVRTATYREYVKKVPDLTKKNFDEMRAYILDYYDGVKVRRSFPEGASVVFDCVVTETQPALRHRRSTEHAAHFFASSSCTEGTIPLRRLALQEMVRFKSLAAFFQK